MHADIQSSDPTEPKTLADIARFERTPWLQRLPATNTYGLLRAACERHPDRVALRLLLAGSADAPTRDLRYCELLEGIHRTANALHALGVSAQVPVAILLPNLIEGHLALWGAQAAGIASPINPLLDASYIARICNETKTQVVIALGPAPGMDIWDKAVQIADRTPSVHTLLQVDLAAALGERPAQARATVRGARPGRADIRVMDFHSALAAAEPAGLASGREIAPDEPCAYFHTGGTTGYPKVAVHRHVNQAFMACALQWIDERRKVLLAGLPLFHVNGALVSGLGALHGGAEIVLLTPTGYRSPGVLDQFWKIAKRFGATSFSAVPTVLASLLSKPWPEGGVPTLRHVLCGAAPLPRQVANTFESQFGVRIHEGYGLTEGTCVTTVNPLQGRRKLGTVGLRLPYQEVQLFALGADGKPAGPALPGLPGVIGIRGPNLFPGYLRPTDNRDIWIEGGWFNTGDLGRWDKEGYLMLCGRAKDLIIRGGHNIDPALIEDVLGSHPAVSMAAAVGQPDRHAGELPVAYVTLAPGASATPEALLEHAHLHTPERAAVPVRIEVLSALPLTAVGKVSKPHLRQLATDHVLREALESAGLGNTSAHSRLTPDRGNVVELAGPEAQRDAALTLVGLYPVAVTWREVNE